MSTQSSETIYLNELIQDEMAVVTADAKLSAALAEFEIASRRYAATRDWVVMSLTGNPYAGDYEWPPEVYIGDLKIGRFRFIHMRIGDAIKEVLREANSPIDLAEIVSRLGMGSLRAATLRSVNAALMQLEGIEKSADGKYQYVTSMDTEKRMKRMF